MEKTIVPRDTRIKLARLDGDLQMEPGGIVEGERIAITGKVVCLGDGLFRGSLSANRLEAKQGKTTVEGSLNIADGLVIEEGSLEVSENLDARTVSADQNLLVGKDFHGETVDVGGLFSVGGRTQAAKVSVGGVYECKGMVDVGQVVVGGSVSIEGVAKIQGMDVGGSVTLAGGDLTGLSEVSGILHSTAPLYFGGIDVGGSIMLTGRNKGRDVDVGGRVRVEGDLEFNMLNVGGRAEITGSCSGVSARVGGRFEVGENLCLSDSLEVGTRVSVGEQLHAKSLNLAGSIEAKLAMVEDWVRIGGMINTREGLKANRIETGTNWEVKGLLVGTEVILSQNGEAEDVYAQELHMMDGAKARNVYAARIQLGDNCSIDGVIEYTESIVVGKGLVVGSGMTRRVRKLPDFPSFKHSTSKSEYRKGQ